MLKVYQTTKALTSTLNLKIDFNNLPVSKSFERIRSWDFINRTQSLKYYDIIIGDYTLTYAITKTNLFYTNSCNMYDLGEQDLHDLVQKEGYQRHLFPESLSWEHKLYVFKSIIENNCYLIPSEKCFYYKSISGDVSISLDIVPILDN